MKTKSIEKIESRMDGVDKNSIRYRALESARNFKASWIELGQALYSVWKDKLYRDWGYGTFDAYTSKEIGIKQPTAVKLLKSYYFLEKEEPSALGKEYSDPAKAASLPSYESVNMLRLARKKVPDEADYARLKKDVFEKGKDVREVKKELTALIRQREELSPDEARKVRKTALLKRLLTTLKTLRNDIEASRMLPSGTLKEISDLIRKIETEVL